MSTLVTLALIEKGSKFVSASILPEVVAFFKAKSAQGLSAQQANEELDSILFDDGMTDEQKRAAIRLEAGAELAEMNAVVDAVQSRAS